MGIKMNFLHKLFNPHCQLCHEDSIVEVLKSELARANFEKEQLLRYVLNQNTPNTNIEVKSYSESESNEPEAVRSKHVPWNVLRETLEAEDRKKAQILREQKENTSKAIQELEKNLKIVSETKLDLGDEDVQDESIQ
jgi:hypothetical protein